MPVTPLVAKTSWPPGSISKPTSRNNALVLPSRAAAPQPKTVAPPVYRPQSTTSQPKLAAPPVYRPQPAASQPKLAAPPVYRPQPAASQPKLAAPPVYRPQPAASQPKLATLPAYYPVSAIAQASSARAAITSTERPSAPRPPAPTPSFAPAQLRLKASTIQRAMRDDSSSSEEEDDPNDGSYEEYQSKKQERFNFLTNTPKNVIKTTAHQVKHFDTGRFQQVWTCPTCGRMLAYQDLNGTFHLTEYGYLSKNANMHSQRALELDHYPTWAPRLKALETKGATKAEKRMDYQDETRLRALCRTCNGSHQYEDVSIDDYDSDESDFEPPTTPMHETQYNSGQYSGYRPPGYV